MNVDVFEIGALFGERHNAEHAQSLRAAVEIVTAVEHEAAPLAARLAA
jgi:hypothetical protein